MQVRHALLACQCTSLLGNKQGRKWKLEGRASVRCLPWPHCSAMRHLLGELERTLLPGLLYKGRNSAGMGKARVPGFIFKKACRFRILTLLLWEAVESQRGSVAHMRTCHSLCPHSTGTALGHCQLDFSMNPGIVAQTTQMHYIVLAG